jgi:hypothetical protein
MIRNGHPGKIAPVAQVAGWLKLFKKVDIA